MYPSSQLGPWAIVNAEPRHQRGYGTQELIASVAYGSTNSQVQITFENPAGTAVTPLGFNVAAFC
jgi:hypothetical protein